MMFVRLFFRKSFLLASFIVALTFTPLNPLWAAHQTSFQVLGNITNTNQGQAFVIDLEMMKANATEYEAIDPGFLKDGKRKFRGISLQTIMKLSGAADVPGVTFIANNVYVTYEVLKTIQSHQVMIAFEMDGKRIKKNRGGPFKVMYSGKVDQGYYNWYIHTVLIGTSLSPQLNVKYQNSIRTLTLKDWNRFPQKRKIEAPPMPRGFGRIELPRKVETRGIALPDFLAAYSDVIQVSFIPFVGKEIVIDGDNLKDPSIMILTHFDESNITSGYGGPYILRFPETISPGESMFFLKEIRID